MAQHIVNLEHTMYARKECACSAVAECSDV